MTARTPTHRAVRRALAAAVTVGVALVALVATLTTLVSSASHPAAADSGSAAVPAYLSVPQNDEEAPVAESLAVGPQAVVMAVDREDERGVQVIGVGAESGAYRVLELPGRLGTDGHSLIGSADADTLALSADGTRLAYPQATHGSGPDALTGVGVVDLISGDVRTVPIDRDGGVRVTGLGLSPDGRWLVWWGSPVLDWQRRGEAAFEDRTVAGLVAPGGDSSEPVPGHRSEGGATYAVADDGTVAIADLRRVRLWDGGEVLASTPAARGIPDSVTTDGTDATHARIANGFALHQTARTPPWASLPAQLRVAPLGVHDWVDVDHAVVTVDFELGVLVLDADEASYTGLSMMDFAPDLLTVATDLVSGEPRVVERPLPDFAASRDDDTDADADATRWWVGGGVLTGGLALALLLRRRRRS